MEASLCAPGLPGLGWRGRGGQDKRRQHSGWHSNSTGNTGGTESLLGLGVSYSWWPCSQLASTHAKRVTGDQAVAYGLKCIKPILSQRRKAQPTLASQWKEHTPNDFQSPKVASSHGNTNVTHLPGHLLPSSGQSQHGFLSEHQGTKG